MNSVETHTLNRLFIESLERFSTQPMIRLDGDGSVFTFSDVAGIVEQVAAGLASLGLKKGDAVVSVSPFNVEALFVFHAAMKLGLLFVPVDHEVPSTMLCRLLDRVNGRAIFCDAARASGFAQIDREIPLVVYDDSHGERETERGELFSRWMPDEGSHFSTVEVRPEDPAVILFTSGTTGEPKGVVLSHGALWRSGKTVHDSWQWGRSDLVFSLGEFHAMSGLRNPGIVPLHAGCSILVTDESTRSSVFSIVDCIDRSACTVLGTTPTLARLMVAHRDRILPGRLHLRHVICTGSELRAETAREFMQYYGVPLYNYYGLTETSGICIAMPEGTDREDLASGSIGLAAGAPFRIVDGELLIGGNNLMSGYWHNSEATDAVLKDGWFHTGDEAVVDERGFVTLKGRRRDIVKDARGNLIHPGEVEEALHSSGLLRDAGVCGFVSPRGDEQLAAFVVPLDPAVNEDDLIEGLRMHVAAVIGRHRLPTVFRVADALPRDHLGSLLRRELRRMLQEKP